MEANYKEIAIELAETLRRVSLSMKAHPDCEEGSEFGDYVSTSEEVLEKFYATIKG